MSYSRIERGPMAADAAGRYFTQISNSLFRDPRISGLAKAVFGLISTHRDGYGISVDAIARHMKEGTGAIKKALRELEQYGYLARTRVRDERGRLGAAVYRITDMPNGFEISVPAPYPDTHFRRSGPGDRNRPLDLTSRNAADSGDESADSERLRRSEPTDENPPVDSPPVENRPPKNTSSKNTNSENTTSPLPPGHTGSASAGAGAQGAPAARGEGEGSPQGTSEQQQGVPSPRSAPDAVGGGTVSPVAGEGQALEGGPAGPDAALVAEIAELRDDWSRVAIRAALQHPAVTERPADLVAEAFRIVAGMDDTNSPGRLAADGPWWGEARRKVQAGARPPLRPRCGDPRHDPYTGDNNRLLYDDDGDAIGICACIEPATPQHRKALA